MEWARTFCDSIDGGANEADGASNGGHVNDAASSGAHEKRARELAEMEARLQVGSHHLGVLLVRGALRGGLHQQLPRVVHLRTYIYILPIARR